TPGVISLGMIVRADTRALLSGQGTSPFLKGSAHGPNRGNAGKCREKSPSALTTRPKALTGACGSESSGGGWYRTGLVRGRFPARQSAPSALHQARLPP